MLETKENLGRLCINSAIHNAAGSLVTSRSQKSHWQEHPQEAIPPFTASGIFSFHGNSTSQNRGMARSRKAGGFVNSAVIAKNLTVNKTVFKSPL